MKIRSFFSLFLSSVSLSSILLIALAAGCGEQVKPRADTPIIRKSSQQLVSPKPSDCSSPAYEVILTLDKALILSLEFTYNLDIQSSLPSSQSLAEGGIPAQFRIAGNSLELIAGNQLKARINSTSADDHPENLIGQFSILEQDDTTITVSGLNSIPYLALQVAAIEGKAQNISFLDHWISSFEFDLSSNLMLQETSLKLADGKTIVKAMESISPIDSAVGHASLVKHFRLLPIQRDLCAQ